MAIFFARSWAVPVWVFVFGTVFMSSATTERAPSPLNLVSCGLIAVGVTIALRARNHHVFFKR